MRPSASVLLQDLSGLYELSLAVGQSLDLEQNCAHFLKKLLARRRLAGAAVWMRDRHTGGFEPVFQLPQRRWVGDGAELAAPGAPRRLSSDELARLWSGAQPAGSLLPLGDTGMLALVGSDPAALDPASLRQLRGVFEKFAVSLEACRAHQALGEAERENRMLSAVARETDNAVVITDAAGRVEWVNTSFERMTGYALHEIHGEKPGDVLQGPATDPATVARISAALREDRSFTEEIVNYSRDGVPYWISMTITPLHDERSVVTGYIAVETDVTEAREREERLLDAQERLRTQAVALQAARRAAESASQHKSRFVAQISHELRAPLTSVLGCVELLDDPGLPAPRRDALLRQLKGNTRYLGSLVNDVLDLSRIEAGKQEATVDAVQVTTLLVEILDMLRERARSKGLTLEGDLSLPPTPLLLDPVRLRQILVNLVGNAIKYTLTGGVTVRARLQLGPAPRLVIAVQDTGPGVSEADQAHLFSAFSRVSDGPAAPTGTGLGLSIAQGFARAMGGDITVTSTLGQGSTFTVDLPANLAAVEEDERPPTQDAPPDLTGKRLLVTDDTPDIRRLLGWFLEATHAEVAVAVHGQDAVDQLCGAQVTGTEPDLIFLDMQMPVLDGYGAARAIRAEGYTGPVVAVSASALAEDRARALDAGCSHWLPKPVQPPQLYGLLAALLA